ncbi:MAG: nucleotidyltransferase family protein [Sphingomonadales bacterium]|nr:nucleotidyltransferase family protein [Sphingomonadales bacterium]
MTWCPQSAMVLAAGLGMRMRPAANGLPKPLVPLGGRPLIDHVLDRIAEAGVPHAVVNVHYCADQIVSHVAHRTCPTITISDESDLILDTGGGVRNALPHLGDSAFLVHNSDSVWLEQGPSNLARLFARWDNSAMDCLMLLAPVETSLGYSGKGDFSLAAAGEIIRRGTAGHADYVFTGVSVMHPRLFAECPPGAFSLNLLWDRAIAAHRIFGLTLDGVWMHVGDPVALDQAEKRLAGAVHP